MNLVERLHIVDFVNLGVLVLQVCTQKRATVQKAYESVDKRLNRHHMLAG